MSERGSARTSERDQLSEIIFMFSGFTFTTGAYSISEQAIGFSPYGFPEENSLCLLSLVIIDMHVILSNNILRSYCVNDKNITLNASTVTS